MSVMFPRLDPLSELAGLHNTMDRIFGDFFGAPSRQGDEGEARRVRTPLPVNVTEDENGYELQAPVPGCNPDQVEVTFADGTLTIKAEREPEQSQRRYLRWEFPWGDSVRQLQLSAEVDPERIEANVQHGLLTVRVPKAAAAQPRRIQVGSGAGKARLVGSS